MLTDIALGQYYPGNSLIHKLDPRTKILITLFFIVAIFLASGAVSYGILWGFVFLIILLSRLPLMLVLKSIKPLWIIIVLTMVIHMFTGQGENVIFSWKFFKVTQEGLEMGLKMSMRLILLLLISSILTFRSEEHTSERTDKKRYQKRQHIFGSLHQIAAGKISSACGLCLHNPVCFLKQRRYKP